jgi:hypothetical protein
MTAWESEAAMRAFRSSGANMKAMPKLLDWCDEASYAHWEQESPELPDWAVGASEDGSIHALVQPQMRQSQQNQA